MMTSSNGNIFRVTGPLCGKFTGNRWIPRTKASGAELWCFLWSAPWINGWVNNREAWDMRCHRYHYDVIVMVKRVRVTSHSRAQLRCTSHPYTLYGWASRCNVSALNMMTISQNVTTNRRTRSYTKMNAHSIMVTWPWYYNFIFDRGVRVTALRGITGNAWKTNRVTCKLP